MTSSTPDSLSFVFTMTAADYRRMIYCNTFGRQPVQTALLCTAWFFSSAVIFLEYLAVIGPLEKVTHGCLLLVSALIPALVGTTEFAVYRFKHDHPEELRAERVMTFMEEGIEQTRDDRENPYFEAWSEFERLYETGAMFIFYRSARQTFLLPKRAVPPDKLAAVRALVHDKIARSQPRKTPES